MKVAMLILLTTQLLAGEPTNPDLSFTNNLHWSTNDLELVSSFYTNRIDLYWDMTNILCTVTNYCPDTIEYMVERGTFTNFVERLAREGHVCNVIGHKWESRCSNTKCKVSHAVQMRHCLICEKHETPEVVWK